MKIEGLGQYNPQNSIETSKEVSQGSEFEAALQKAYNEGDKTKLKEACNQFESLLLKNLYQQMKATVPKNDLFGDSNAREIFQDMLDEELMNRGSQRGMGISGMMYKQLSAQMERTFKVADKSSSDETGAGNDGDAAMNADVNVNGNEAVGK